MCWHRLSSVVQTTARLIYRPSVCLSFLVLAGWMLRAWGITFGLPFPYHVDEPGYLTPAWRLPRLDTPDFSPSSYLLFGAYRVTCLISNLPGLPDYVRDSCTSQAESAPAFFLLGRLLSVLYGSATILLTYWLGKELFGSATGLIAAAFLTFTFLHVRDSHYATPDVPQAFFIACALYFCARIRRQKNTYYYVAVGLCAGLAVATKVTAGLLIVPILWAHFSPAHTSRRQILQALLDPRILLTGSAALATVLIGNAQLVVNPMAYLRRLYGLFRLGGTGGFGVFQIDAIPGWIFYLRALGWGMGFLLAPLSVAGALYAIYRHSREDVLLLSFLLPYYAYMGRSSIFFARYAIPMLPILALLAARLMEAALSNALPNNWRRVLAAGVLAGAIVTQPLYSTIRHNILLTRTDTRTLARDWILDNIPATSKLAIEWHSPFLPQSRYDVQVTSVVGLSEYVLGPSTTTTGTVELYRETGFDYLIASSFIYDVPLIDPRADQERRLFYSSLDKEATLIKEFRPHIGEIAPPFAFDRMYGPTTSLSEFERPGPTIRIYALGSHLGPEPR